MSKWAIILLVCSLEAKTCMPPIQLPSQFNDSYDCMVRGYNESLRTIQEIGRENVNRDGIYIKFVCERIEVI